MVSLEGCKIKYSKGGKKKKKCVCAGKLPQSHPYSLSATVQVLVDGAPVRIQLWDTAGQVSSVKGTISSGPVGQGLFAGFCGRQYLTGKEGDLLAQRQPFTAMADTGW